MIYFSYVKKLRNAQHAAYAKEFLEGMPRGVYENKKTDLERLIEAEWTNLNNCRKNHSREDFNEKVNQLRSVMSALRIVLYREAQLKKEGAVVEYHNYVLKILGQRSNVAFASDVKAFIKSWSGSESPGAEALLDEARELVHEVDNIVALKEKEDLMIANIPGQRLLRLPTDDLIYAIIQKADVEKFELSPSVESEAERLEVIEEFLAFVDNWIGRVMRSVKNYGKDEPEPEPDSEPEPEPDIDNDLNV